jgi:hypothetical protein
MSTERRERGAAAGRGVPGSGSARRRGRACDVGDGNGASVGVSGGEPNMQVARAGAVREYRVQSNVDLLFVGT